MTDIDYFSKKKFFLYKNGYVVLENYLSKKIRERLIKFCNYHSKEKMNEWKRKKLLKKNFKLKNYQLYKKFIQIYLKAGKPKYTRQPKYYIANKYFFNVLNDELLTKTAKFFLGSDQIWASDTHNFRYKSSYFPWSKIPWHADLTYWKETKNKNFNFLIFWMSLEDLKNTHGSVSLIPRSQEGINSFEKKFKYKKIFYSNKTLKKFKKIKIELKKNDLLIMDSKTIHKSIPYHKSKIAWTIDVRYEKQSDLSEQTKKYGFKIVSNKKQKERNLKNFILKTPSFIENYGFNK